MATIEKNGKRWHIRKANGELLLDTRTGKPRYFHTEAWAKHFAANVTNQEQNPRPPSWRDAVQAARANVWPSPQREEKR